MELEAAARRLLLTDNAVTGYVQAKVFKFRLEEKVDGTSGRAIVVARDGGWTSPDTVRTPEYPVLQIQCHADHDRDVNGSIVEANALDKAWALYRVVDPLFHGMKAPRGQWIGAVGSNPGLFVVSSARLGEPYTVTAEDVHGKLQATRETLGDTAYVSASYALQVVH